MYLFYRCKMVQQMIQKKSFLVKDYFYHKILRSHNSILQNPFLEVKTFFCLIGSIRKCSEKCRRKMSLFSLNLHFCIEKDFPKVDDVSIPNFY